MEYIRVISYNPLILTFDPNFLSGTSTYRNLLAGTRVTSTSQHFEKSRRKHESTLREVITPGMNASPGVLWPIGSMYGIFAYIYHSFQPNVGKYTSPMDP